MTITISSNELHSNGYLSIESQSTDGEVILENADGGLELFMIRNSCSGWCLDTEQGSVLEFIRSIPDEG